MSSPLILGMDVTNASLVKSVWPIISNKAAIAVNQAWHGHPGRRVLPPPQAGHCRLPACKFQVWAKKLGGGKDLQAVLVLNSGSAPLTTTLRYFT